MRFRFWPVGTASARRGSAHIQAYRYDGVPQADLHGADGTCLTVEQLRELRDMLSAVIARLEQVGAAALALVALALTLASCAPPAEPEHLVASYTIHVERRFGEDERAAIVAGASRWTGTAVRIAEGDRWGERIPSPTASGCTSDVYIGWASPDDPMLVGDLADVVGVGIASCGVRYVGLVHGRVSVESMPAVVAHELGHAMGLEHVETGIMATPEDRVATSPSSADWRAFCAVHRCSEAP